MKKMILAAIFFAVATGIQAQPPRGKHQKLSKEEMISHRIEWMDKQLNLTDKQKKEVKAILADEMKDMPSPEQLKAQREAIEAKHKEMRERHEATDKKIEKVLTAEQKAKYAELKKHHRGGKGHKGHRRPNGQKPPKAQSSCCEQQ